MNVMKCFLAPKVLPLILKKYTCKGFTLIELLVVILIVGALSAITIPSLLNNVGKSRETEATTNLGALSRSQQAYHFETQEFASSLNNLDQNISLVSKYYDFPDPSVANADIVKQQAIAVAPWNNASRNYAFGIYYNAGSFNSVFCRAKGVSITVEAPNAIDGNCTNNGVQIR